MCTHRKVVVAIGLIKVKATDPIFPPTYIFGAALPAWSVLESDCVMADQPQKVFNKGHICDQIVQGL